MLAAGLVDEVRMDVTPVVFGSGKRYFGSVSAQHLLEDPDVVIQGNRVLHLRYQVRRSPSWRAREEAPTTRPGSSSRQGAQRAGPEPPIRRGAAAQCLGRAITGPLSRRQAGFERCRRGLVVRSFQTADRCGPARISPQKSEPWEPLDFVCRSMQKKQD